MSDERFGARDVTGLKPLLPFQARSYLKVGLVLAWLVTTIALAGWWLLHGLNQIARFGELGGGPATELARWHRMYLSEGAALVLLLFIGGGSLLYYIMTEIRRTRRVSEFFAAFTHDLKTSLASLRLQAESLEEDLTGSAQARLARRLVKDTVRLSLQLENSLFLASTRPTDLHVEKLEARDEFLRLQHDWPELQLRVVGDAEIRADSRAFESIVKNLVQNAVVHGRATRVSVSISAADAGFVRLRFEDDGRGFKGDVKRLGRMFHRHTGTSGSGIGLYLVSTLARQMGGQVRVNAIPEGQFVVDVILPGRAPIGTDEVGGEA